MSRMVVITGLETRAGSTAGTDLAQVGTHTPAASPPEPDPNVGTLPTRLVTEGFDPSKLETKERT